MSLFCMQDLAPRRRKAAGGRQGREAGSAETATVDASGCLAVRFKLRSHWDTRKVDGFVLVTRQRRPDNFPSERPERKGASDFLGRLRCENSQNRRREASLLLLASRLGARVRLGSADGREAVVRWDQSDRRLRFHPDLVGNRRAFHFYGCVRTAWAPDSGSESIVAGFSVDHIERPFPNCRARFIHLL
jgi:hypothetical protein